MKKTAWFPMSVRPVRKGVYELLLASGKKRAAYSRWSGSEWRMSCKNPTYASEQRYPSAMVECGDFAGWRGLAEPPK